MSYNQQGRGNIHGNGVRQIYSRKVGTLTIHKEQTDAVLCCLTIHLEKTKSCLSN